MTFALIYKIVVAFELLLLSLFSLRKKADSPFSFLPTLFFLFVLISEIVSSGRPIFSPAFLLPGSLATRILELNLDPAIRRLIDPSIICLFFLSRNISLFPLCMLIIFEGIFISNDFKFLISNISTFTSLHLTLQQIFIISLIFSFYKKEKINLKLISYSWITTFIVILAVSFLPFKTSTLIGAHYYSWFPENWSHGYIGEKLIPPIMPAMGEYKSGESEVVAKHLTWAEEAGINLFVFDWWPKRPKVRQNVESAVEELSKFPQMKFTIMYETLDLKDYGDDSIENEDPNVVYLTTRRIDRLKKQINKLVKKYFHDPQYLRLYNRPVIFFYASRQLLGDVEEAFREVRRYVKKKTGFDLYIVGDETFFNVLDYKNNKIIFLPDNKPNWKRLILFDAVTCYNPYESIRKEHAGSNGAQKYLQDVEKLFRSYQNYASTLGIDFIPSALPGYNDRGVRLKEDHYVLPREIKHSKENFFKLNLDRLVYPFINKDKPFFVVTSWNEWNEGTQIEPSIENSSESIEENDSVIYSQGEVNQSYGLKNLKIIKEFTKKIK